MPLVPVDLSDMLIQAIDKKVRRKAEKPLWPFEKASVDVSKLNGAEKKKYNEWKKQSDEHNAREYRSRGELIRSILNKHFESELKPWATATREVIQEPGR